MSTWILLSLKNPGLKIETWGTRPNGLRGSDAPVAPATDNGDDDSIGGPGTPVSLTFLGGLYQDAKLCAFARAYQQASGFETLHPKLP